MPGIRTAYLFLIRWSAPLDEVFQIMFIHICDNGGRLYGRLFLFPKHPLHLFHKLRNGVQNAIVQMGRIFQRDRTDALLAHYQKRYRRNGNTAAAKPKPTFEIGRMTLPSGVSTGSPMIVFTSTICFKFSIAVRIRP
jgi:hypothetical protein